MKTVTTAREVAVRTLMACERQGAWSDGHLKKAIRQGGLDRRDAALATRLCYGVQQNRLLLDFYLGHFCTIRVEKLEPGVRAALRVALYQLAMMDQIPPSAAVDQAVAMVKKLSRSPKAPGLVNAVLRAFLRAGEDLPEVRGETAAHTLSLRYSHPLWLVEEWMERLGEEGAEALLRANNGQPAAAAQVNLLRTTDEAFAAAMAEAGAVCTPHPWLAHCHELSATGDLTALAPFREGLFYIQDAAARLAADALGAKPGWRVLDCCAAPGGKSFAAAMGMEDRGEVVSCDIHPHKLELIAAGAKRLGLSIIRPVEQNARHPVPDWEGAFDGVLADVPCSGLGIIRKKPDIRFKDPAPLAGLPAVQRDILDNVSACVRPGGVLVYSTCTLRREENEAVAEGFLREHSDFLPVPLDLPVGEGGAMATLWPHLHGTDGFFIAKFRRAP